MNSPELIIFLLSTLPMGELRLTIPLALGKYNMSFFEAMLYSVLGVVAIVIVISFVLEPIVNLLRKINFFDRIVNWIFERTRKKHGKKVQLWGNLALVVISAIPIPVLGGAWTAYLVAFIFDLPRWSSLIMITIGTIISGFIVLGLTQGISSII